MGGSESEQVYLVFEHGEEGFGYCVVMAIAGTSYRGHRAVGVGPLGRRRLTYWVLRSERTISLVARRPIGDGTRVQSELSTALSDAPPDEMM